MFVFSHEERDCANLLRGSEGWGEAGEREQCLAQNLGGKEIRWKTREERERGRGLKEALSGSSGSVRRQMGCLILIKYAENQGRRQAGGRSRTGTRFNAFTWGLYSTHVCKLCKSQSDREEETPLPAGLCLRARAQLVRIALAGPAN